MSETPQEIKRVLGRLADAHKVVSDIKSEIKVLEDNLGLANAILAQANEVAVRLMQDAELEKATTEYGTFVVTPIRKAWITVANKEDFHAWLRSHDLGGLITESVHFKTLSTWAWEAKEKGDSVPEFVNMTEGSEVKIYPSRKK